MSWVVLPTPSPTFSTPTTAALVTSGPLSRVSWFLLYVLFCRQGVQQMSAFFWLPKPAKGNLLSFKLWPWQKAAIGPTLGNSRTCARGTSPTNFSELPELGSLACLSSATPDVCSRKPSPLPGVSHYLIIGSLHPLSFLGLFSHR